MPAVLRNGKVASTEAREYEAMLSRQNPKPDLPKPSPFLLLVYPVILALGSAFSSISPTASFQQQSFTPGVAADLNTPTTSAAVNYFAGKRNLVNVLFVKKGWAWTTLAFILLQATLQPSKKSSDKKQNHYVQAALRYILVTISWVLTTQWFFGPGLVDRSFTLTGGHCEALPAKMQTDPITKLTSLTSSTACKAAGGRWRGGHDISGHVFILALSSAFLLYELYLADRHSSHPSVSPRAAANVAHEMSEQEKRDVGGWESETAAKFRIYARYFLYVVVALDFWMLMMTAIWFHTWLEKVNGMLIAGLTLWITYFLGEFVPAWRGIIGGL